MARNPKILRLILVSAIAMGALAAPTARAQSEQGELTTESGQDVTLDVTERPGAATLANSLTMFGETFHCPGTTYTGHESDVTPHDLIANKSTAVTLTPDYADPCHVSGGRQMTVNTHGCDFELAIGKTTPVESKEGTYGAETSIDCPDPTKGITVTVFGNTPPSAEGSDLCTIEFTGTETINQGIGGVHVTNKAAGGSTPVDYLALAGTLTGIHVERTGLCSFLGGNTNETTEFHIDATVKGTNIAGEGLGITVSDDSPPEESSFKSDVPVTLDVTETGKAGANALTAFGSSVECPGSFYTGHKVGGAALIESGETAATFTPTYKQPCTGSGGGLRTVAMNGCDYVLEIGDTTGGEDTYGVTTDVVCPAGKAIHVSFYGAADTKHESRLCTVEVGPQTGLAGADVTSGTTPTFDLTLAGTLEGIHIERTGLCVFDGQGSTTGKGSIDLDATVQATDGSGKVVGVTVAD